MQITAAPLTINDFAQFNVIASRKKIFFRKALKGLERPKNSNRKIFFDNDLKKNYPNTIIFTTGVSNGKQ